MEKITTATIRKMKSSGKKITMLTCYDYPLSLIMDEAGIDIMLVGDSLGMVMLGHETTLQVTIEDMIRYTQAVARGNKKALIIADMPFLSYEITSSEAIRNAGRLIKEGAAEGVKIEGGYRRRRIVKSLVGAGIPVMGHIGLTPQSVHQIGGYKVCGRTPREIKALLQDARALEEAGVFAIVLECIPLEVAKLITEAVTIPTIGIGAGPHCDGQVLVIHDMLGLFDRFAPKHAKQYVNLIPIIKRAIGRFRKDVQTGRFPTRKYSFCLNIKKGESLKYEKF